MFQLQAAKIVGGLLGLTGLFGILILLLDKVLAESAPSHQYALVLFVVLDFAIGGSVLVKPSKSTFTAAAVWSLIRIIVQIADVSQAHQPGIQMRYTQFADYLFNPASSSGTSAGNPPGVPALFIDLIMLLELVVIVVAWKARSQKQKLNSR